MSKHGGTSSQQQPELLGLAGGLTDIIRDFEGARKIAAYTSSYWHDTTCLPVVDLDGYAFFQREHVFNSLLMIYRRPFVPGHRFKIPDEWIESALADLTNLHFAGLIARANNVVAHSIDACSSTIARFADGTIQYMTARPGHNQYDFDNLVAAFDRWLSFLRSRLKELEETINSNPPAEDEYPSEFFMAPFGSGVQQQALRTGRPQERTRNKLKKSAVKVQPK